MDPLSILAALKAAAELAKAAPAIVEQARWFLSNHDDPDMKKAVEEVLAAYEADHARVMDKLRAAAAS